MRACIRAEGETVYYGVTFKGIYSPEILRAGDKSRLYIGADDKLYYATGKDLTINGCRGYFILDNIIQTKTVNLVVSE